MGYRERESYKKFLAEEKEARERPIREATEKLKQTYRRIAAEQRSRLSGEVADIAPYISEDVDGWQPNSEATVAYNVHAVKTFFAAHKELLVSDANLQTLGRYLDRNNIRLVSQAMLEKLYADMTACGITFEMVPPPVRREPLPSPAPQTATPKAAVPVTFDGFDLETGAPRTYSSREVDRMSATEYRRVFRLVKNDLSIPNIGPGPFGRL